MSWPADGEQGDPLEKQNFKVHLAGIISLLSDHLYSSDKVFVRELLQNAVDAIRARQITEPDARCSVRFSFIEETACLTVYDNGIGLTEDEARQFLSSIGASSKRELADHRSTFIGQFGIGMLSCFMISPEVRLMTQSQQGGPAIEWIGREDGTYTIEQHPSLPEPGTKVELILKESKRQKFNGQEISRLLKYYGELLSLPIECCYYRDGEEHCEWINAEWVFPDDVFQAVAEDRDKWLQYGKTVFEFPPIDVIPLQTNSGGTKGFAYILPRESHPRNNPKHRVYLKQMLLSDKLDDFLPDWAFFVQAVINTEELQPIASREGFYEDDELKRIKKLLGRNIRQYMRNMHLGDPVIRDQILQVHQNAIKDMAEADSDLYRTVIPDLVFPTTEGHMTMRDYLQRVDRVQHVFDMDEYRKVLPLAKKAGQLIILSRYNNDEKLLNRLPQKYEGLQVERVGPSDFMDFYGELSVQEQNRWAPFIAQANEVLNDFQCRASLKRFEPADLPALLEMGTRVMLDRSKEKPEEHPETPDVWSIIGKISGGKGNHSELYLNLNNPQIQQLMVMKEASRQHIFIRFFYLQALMMGRYILTDQELQALNEGLLELMVLTNPQ